MPLLRELTEHALRDVVCCLASRSRARERELVEVVAGAVGREALRLGRHVLGAVDEVAGAAVELDEVDLLLHGRARAPP